MATDFYPGLTRAQFKKETSIFGATPKKKNKRQPVSTSQKNEVLARQNNKCARCHKPLDMRAKHLDHKKEVYKGGKSKISNLQYLCANCHNIKTHEDKLKKVEKRRNSKPKQDFGILGFNPKPIKIKSLWS
ncbi:MAG: HNH endonuclease signature motif containing protein [Nanoarchaeota archaeon]